MRPGAWLVLLALLVPSIGSAGLAAVSAQPVTAAAAVTGGRILVLLRLPPPHIRVGGDYAGSYGDGAGRAARHRVAAALARRNGLALVDDWPMPLLAVDCFVMAVPADRSPIAVAATLSDLPEVAWSQPVNAFATQGSVEQGPVKAATPVRRPDPLFQAQPAALGWHLADLHRITDGRGVKVAIVDSAIDRRHPDLVGQVSVSANFVVAERDVPEQHGTAVAGIIGAIAGNGVGIAGIAPRARLMALRACWQQPAKAGGATVCDSFSLAKAIYFAVEHRAGVLNLSLGGPQDPLLARLLDLALARGITIVAAVDRASADGAFPASHPGVVAVVDDVPGPLRTAAVVAPGRGVPTTNTGASWWLVDGSSYAAAHVSGLFALMRSRQTATLQTPVLVLDRAGKGTVDSCASLLPSAGDCNCNCPSRTAATPRQ